MKLLQKLFGVLMVICLIELAIFNTSGQTRGKF